MEVERTISEIESLEDMYEMPDIRPLTAEDALAASQRHDKKQAKSPWFRLWQHYSICCRRVSGTPAWQNRVLEWLAVYSYQFRFPRRQSATIGSVSPNGATLRESVTHSTGYSGGESG